VSKLYPLKFKPIYKKKIWGGRNLAEKFKRDIPAGKIGESWEIAARKIETSIVSNGPLTGKSLKELFKTKKEKLMGSNFKNQDNFPLLIKFLDAHRKLSVQVHPTKEYSHQVKKASSKTEMWYIIDAKPGAKIVYGLKPEIDKNTLK
jgi:mannose-6-phosphate isomerase